jgi:hypothetical protein
MKYKSALKKMEIWICTTWMNLENTMISQISQSQKGKYCMMAITRGLGKSSKWGI